MRSALMFTASLILAATTGGALAQSMFKCVGPTGKVSYSDLPCASKGGSMKELDVRANVDDAERESRRKTELAKAAAGDTSSPLGDIASIDDQNIKLAKQKAEAERPLTEAEKLKVESQKRIKADQDARAEASRLWTCRRGPKPQDCK